MLEHNKPIESKPHCKECEAWRQAKEADAEWHESLKRGRALIKEAALKEKQNVRT